MQQSSDIYTFAFVLSLPFVAWVISRPPVWRRVRRRLEPVGSWLWSQVVENDGPDEALQQRWALVRLERLRGDLERVQLLLADDDWMSATRQVGNRLAYERLRSDVSQAELTVSTFALVEAPAAPTPMATPRLTFVAPAARTAVEVMEFGPTGRWL